MRNPAPNVISTYFHLLNISNVLNILSVFSAYHLCASHPLCPVLSDTAHMSPPLGDTPFSRCPVCLPREYAITTHLHKVLLPLTTCLLRCYHLSPGGEGKGGSPFMPLPWWVGCGNSLPYAFHNTFTSELNEQMFLRCPLTSLHSLSITCLSPKLYISIVRGRKRSIPCTWANWP